MDEGDELFDKEKFSRLLTIAQGRYSLNEYAKKTRISNAHISRLINLKVEVAPNPDTLRKFAYASENRVSYIDFMLAAGHVTSDDLIEYNTVLIRNNK